MDMKSNDFVIGYNIRTRMSHIVHEATHKKICGAKVHGTFMVTGDNIFRKKCKRCEKIAKKEGIEC